MHSPTHVAHTDILDDASSAIVGLDTDHTVKSGKSIWQFSTKGYGSHLKSHCRSPRRHDRFHTAVAHDDVFRRMTVTTVAVTAALDGDAVVAGVEVAAFDKHILAGIRITAIAIGTFVLHMDMPDDHIVAECG